MPQDELLDSFKSKLWDFKYTPFLSSLVIAWLIWNYEMVLIFFADINDINVKIRMLHGYSFFNTNLPPLVAALFYTFLYPFISNIFYDATLYHKNKAHKIKQLREDEKVITQKEKKEIFDEIKQVRLENYKLENEKVQLIKDFEVREKLLENKIIEYQKVNEKLNNETKEDNEYSEKTEIEKNDRYIHDLDEKEIYLLKSFTDKVWKEHQVLNEELRIQFNINTVQAQSIINKLIEEDILKKNVNNNILLTKLGVQLASDIHTHQA